MLAAGLDGGQRVDCVKREDGNGREVSICFVAEDAYGAMRGGHTGHIGGVEWQTSLMARWFAARGHLVSMLTWDEGRPKEESIDGVRVIKMCRRDAGLKGLRFFHPRWSSLIRAMGRANSDLYYQNCAEYVTGQVAHWCRCKGRRFVYSVASEPDCDRALPKLKKLRERLLYRYGLAHADRLIVQTRKQQEMLLRGFRLESTRIPMPCPGPTAGEYESASPADQNSCRILWIGRICRSKRPDRLLAIATACPDLVFDVVGPAYDNRYVRSVVAESRAIPNVVVHGPVSRRDVPSFYRRASLVCCTSTYEGFPNTFLEAWSHGLPVVSTFDPDDLICGLGLGAVSDDVPGLVASMRKLIESPERWRQASQNARRYYLENHTMEAVMPRFEEVFLDVLKGEGRRYRYSC